MTHSFVDQMTPKQIDAAVRFNECVEDGQDYDVPAQCMVELAHLGLVVDQGNGFYSQTDLMLSVESQLVAISKLKKATVDELELHDIPCGFDIKFIAANDPTQSNQLWWHVHSEQPVWNNQSREWETEGKSYEIGTFSPGEAVPSILKNIAPEASLFMVIK